MMPMRLTRWEDEDGTLVKLLSSRSRVSMGDVEEMLRRTDDIAASPRPCDAQFTVTVLLPPAVRSQLQVAMETEGGHQQLVVVRAEKAVESWQVPPLINGK